MKILSTLLLGMMLSGYVFASTTAVKYLDTACYQQNDPKYGLILSKLTLTNQSVSISYSTMKGESLGGYSANMSASDFFDLGNGRYFIPTITLNDGLDGWWDNVSIFIEKDSLTIDDKKYNRVTCPKASGCTPVLKNI